MLHRKEDAEDIYRKHLLHHGIVRLGDFREGVRDAGIVDRDVEAAVRVSRVCDEMPVRCVLADIAGFDEDVRAM